MADLEERTRSNGPRLADKILIAAFVATASYGMYSTMKGQMEGAGIEPPSIRVEASDRMSEADPYPRETRDYDRR